MKGEQRASQKGQFRQGTENCAQKGPVPMLGLTRGKRKGDLTFSRIMEGPFLTVRLKRRHEKPEEKADSLEASDDEQGRMKGVGERVI